MDRPGKLRSLRQGTNGTLLSNRGSPTGLVLGDTSGVGHFLQYGNNTYTENFTRQLATDCDPFGYAPCLNGLQVTSDNSLWTGTGSILNQRSSLHPMTTSPGKARKSATFLAVCRYQHPQRSELRV